MDINVKFTGIEWWSFKLQEANDQKIEHKIKHAEKQLEIAKYLNKNNYEYREPKLLYSLKINYE
jgi:hypothetical protein